MSSSTESRTGIMVDLSRAGPLPSETKVRLTSETVKVTRSGDVSQKLGHSVSWVRPKPIRWPTSGMQVSQTWDSLRMGPRFLPRLRACHGPPRGPRHMPRLPTVSRVPFVGHTRLLRARKPAHGRLARACGPRLWPRPPVCGPRARSLVGHERRSSTRLRRAELFFRDICCLVRLKPAHPTVHHLTLEALNGDLVLVDGVAKLACAAQKPATHALRPPPVVVDRASHRSCCRH